MSEREFWWASVNGREPQVIEVTESHGIRFVFATGTDFDLSAADVRLIERVVPAGRTAAAVEKLQSIPMSRHADFTIEYACEAIAILQGEMPSDPLRLQPPARRV